MTDDAKEAALSLLSLAPNPVPIIPLKRKQSISLTSPQDDVSSEAISCICGLTYDDGFSIACDKCSRWCHAACFDIVEGGVPEEWQCWVCKPREVDRERAFKLQKARQKQVEDLKDLDKARRRPSPGIDRKHRRTSAPAMDGTNSKRKRRPSIVQPTANHHHHSNNEDEHVDIDEPWTHSYIPITQDIIPSADTRDRLRRQAQHWRGVTALSPSSPHPLTPVQLPPNHHVPHTTVQPLPPGSYTHPALSLYTNHSVRPPSYSVHTTTPIQSKQYIAPFVSTITPTSTYLADPLNAYAHLGMPKPFVHLMGPPLDVALDARLSGGKSRFVRSGCRPNAVLRPILCPKPSTSAETSPISTSSTPQSDSESLTFGVFALRDLKANEEVVLGWEWDDGNAVHSLPALIESPHMFPSSRFSQTLHGHPPTPSTPTVSPSPVTTNATTAVPDSPEQIRHLRNQMANILHALASAFATCACGSKSKDCVITQIAAFVDGEIPSGTPKSVDLGPLIGVKRGFKTRERVPFSGGMTGVEMCEDSTDELGDSTTETERQVLGHGRLKVKTKARERRKGKGAASDEGGNDNGRDGLPAQSPVGYLPPSLSANCPPRHRPPEPPPRSDDAMDVDLSIEEVEAKMPPKLRKRWIQRESEALRELNGRNLRNSQSPRITVSSPANGAGAAQVKGPQGINGASGLGIRVEDDDKTDTDDDRDHEMPPPSIPAMLNPPVVSSTVISRRGVNDPLPSQQHVVQLSRSQSPMAPPASVPMPASSPSTSFANLSLLSPMIPSMSSPRVAASATTTNGTRTTFATVLSSRISSEADGLKVDNHQTHEARSSPLPQTPQPETPNPDVMGELPPATSSPSEPSSSLTDDASPPPPSSNSEPDVLPLPSVEDGSSLTTAVETIVSADVANPPPPSSPSPRQSSAPPLPEVEAPAAAEETPSTESDVPVPMDVDQEPPAPDEPPSPQAVEPAAPEDTPPPTALLTPLGHSPVEQTAPLPEVTSVPEPTPSESPVLPRTPAPISIASLMNPSSPPSPVAPPPAGVAGMMEGGSGSGSSAAPAKVKISLKDFALRKKKQKEEEEKEKELKEKEEKERMEKEAQEEEEREAKEREEEEKRVKANMAFISFAAKSVMRSKGSSPVNDSPELEFRAITHIPRRYDVDALVAGGSGGQVPSTNNASGASDVANHSGLNGSARGSPVSLRAKVEMVEGLLSESSTPPGLGLAARWDSVGQSAFDFKKPVPTSPARVSPQAVARHHVRRPSREDGEIPSTGDDTPPPVSKDRDEYFPPVTPLSASSSSSNSYHIDHPSQPHQQSIHHSLHISHNSTTSQHNPTHNHNHNHHPHQHQQPFSYSPSSVAPPTGPRSFLSPRNTTPSPSVSASSSVPIPTRRPSLPLLRAGHPGLTSGSGSGSGASASASTATTAVAVSSSTTSAGVAPPSSRPPPRGPRALYNGGSGSVPSSVITGLGMGGSGSAGGSGSGMSMSGGGGGGGGGSGYSSYSPSSRLYAPPPRRPLADRDRLDRDRRPGPILPRASSSRGVGWNR